MLHQPLFGPAVVAIRHHPEGLALRPGGQGGLARRHWPVEGEAAGRQGTLRLRPAGRRRPVARLLRRDGGGFARAVEGVFGEGNAD